MSRALHCEACGRPIKSKRGFGFGPLDLGRQPLFCRLRCGLSFAERAYADGYRIRSLLTHVGLFAVARDPGEKWKAGEPLYFDDVRKYFTNRPNGEVPCGEVKAQVPGTTTQYIAKIQPSLPRGAS